MKSKVILFCILLFSSKIVDSNPHAEGLLRHRVNQPSIWQDNQNAQDARYLDTDFTQTQKVNTLTNSAIQQESSQDYSLNQGRHNHNGYRYNKSPVPSPQTGKQLLDNYNLQTDERRSESYPPRVESYPSEVGFDNQQFRKQNWRPQNLYTNPVPSTVLITDNEGPLVNTVQEPYRAPVQYIQPKYVSSANRRFYQPDRPYQIREQLQYPLANNAGDSEYVANPGPRFRSIGPVSYDNYSEGQAEASEIKTKLTNGPRYLHNLPPQSGNVYNEIPLVIATDTLTDKSENIKYLENYKPSSDLSNTASSANYERGSSVVESYSLDSRLSNLPESLESYSEGQISGSEIKTRLSSDRRHIQSFAPQSEIIYNKSPVVIATDTLEDRFENIKTVENYRSSSDLTQTVPTTNYDDNSQVISADNYNLHSRPSNGPVSYKSYDDGKAAESEVNPSRLIEAQRDVQSFAHQPRIIYNDIPAVIAADVLADESSNIRYENRENSKLHSELSNTAQTKNYDADSSAISAVEIHNEGSRPSNNPVPHVKYRNIQPALSVVRHRPIGGQKYLHKVAPEPRIVHNDVPAVIATDILADQSNNIRYEEREDYESNSDLSNIGPVTYQDETPQVISTVDNTDSDSQPSNPVPENIVNEAPLGVNKILSDKPLARRYAHNYIPETGSSNTENDKSFTGVPNVVSETVEENSGVYEVNYGQNEPTPINTYSETLPISTHTVSTKHQINKIEDSDVPSHEYSSHTSSNNPDIRHKMKELNLNKFKLQKLMDGSAKPYLVIHPNGTVEHLDTIDLDSQQHSYLRLVNIKRINVDETEGEETSEPNIIAKTFEPQNEIPLPEDTQPADYRPLNENQNSAYEFDSTVLNKALPADKGDSKTPNYVDNLKQLTPVVNQPADDDNPKLPLVNQQGDGDKFKPLHPYIRHRTHHHESKPTDAFDNKSKPSIPDGNLLAVENSKSKPNDSYLSSPDKKQPSDINAANLPWTENQSGNDKNSESLSHPHKRSHIHHHKSKLSNINQPTEDADSSPFPNEKQPLDDKNYKTLPLNENQSIADIDSQTLHLHKNKPIHHHHTSKHSHSNQPRDANIVSSSSSSENKPADDKDSKTSYPVINEPTDDNNSELSNKSQERNNNKLKIIHTQYKQPAHHDEPIPTHENEPEDNKKIKPSFLDENISTNDDNFPKNKPDEDDKSKPLSPHIRQPALHSKPKLSHEDQSQIDEIINQNKSEEDNNSNSRLPSNNQTVDDETSENKPEGDNIFNSHKGKPTHHNQLKLSHEDQSKNFKKIPNDKPDNIEAIDDNTFLESQPRNKTEIKPVIPHYRKPAHHTEPKPSYDDQSEYDDTYPQNKPGDDLNSKTSLLDDINLLDDDAFPERQLKNKNKSKPRNPHKKQPEKHNKEIPSYGNQSENNEDSPKEETGYNKNFNSSFLDGNKSTDYDAYPEHKVGNNNTSKPQKPHKRKSALYTPKLSQEEQSGNDEKSPKDKPGDNNNYDTPFSDDDESIGDDSFPESQPRNNNKFKPISSHKKQPGKHNNRNLSYENQSENYGNSPEDKSRDNNSSNSSFLKENIPSDDDTFENKPEDKKSTTEDDDNFYLSPPDDNESIEDDNSLESPPLNNKKNKPIHPPNRQSAHHNEPQFSREDQSENDDTYLQDETEEDDNSNPWPLDDNQSEEDDTYLENNPEDDINSVSTPVGENESGHNKKKTVVGKTDDQSVSTTSAPAVPNYTESSKPRVVKKYRHRHVNRKSTTKSLIVTTPSPNETSDDQIITLSPIEQATDNVSDAPLVTTTTAKPPTKTSGGKSDKIKETKNKKNNSVTSSSKDFASIKDKVRTSTKASTRSSTKMTNGKDDGKTTKEIVSNKNTQTNDNESQVNNVKNAQTVQSAVYDSSELLDTNTDVLAESDDNSPVTTSPSVQSDVNTSDASGANTLEFEQPETDVIITVSSSTDNDSEDDIITINVEIFESTGSYSNNKSLLVNIDTDNESDDNFEIQQPSDCDKDHNDKNDDGKSKNLEIVSDLSNLQGEPTMWIRTTNQDFIEKLMNKNDTEFDMVYFFNIVNKPIIEREKVTTIHCNGTVVIETKEITYANKDDQTPTIVKTTETMQIEDYKRYCLDSSSD